MELKTIFNNKHYGIEIFTDREKWIVDLHEIKTRKRFRTLESMLEYLMEFYLKRNAHFVEELEELSVELGEVYDLISRIAKSKFYGWEEGDNK